MKWYYDRNSRQNRPHDLVAADDDTMLSFYRLYLFHEERKRKLNCVESVIVKRFSSLMSVCCKS